MATDLILKWTYIFMWYSQWLVACPTPEKSPYWLGSHSDTLTAADQNLKLPGNMRFHWAFTMAWRHFHNREVAMLA